LVLPGYGRARRRRALDLYVLYQWVKLEDWFARVGSRDGLPEIAGKLHAITAV
jgi:hypothetical protein